jgi:predicted nucleic acid-binding protein
VLRVIRTDEARVPALWWFEVRNILVINERRKRLTESDSAAFLTKLGRLRFTIDRSPGEADVLMLARRHRLSVYDASYLELALRDGISLATLDNQLVSAASAAGSEFAREHGQMTKRARTKCRGERPDDGAGRA